MKRQFADNLLPNPWNKIANDTGLFLTGTSRKLGHNQVKTSFDFHFKQLQSTAACLHVISMPSDVDNFALEV
jgi:hypothetical protein